MELVSRRRSLLIRELGVETLVYDMESHRASCLNREAAAVFKACDGTRSLSEIRRRVSQRLGEPVDEGYLELAIDRLARRGLVDPVSKPPSAPRRELLRRLAAASALALPSVISVLAPTAAEAQTCLANGKMCMDNGECCSNQCKMMMCEGMN
jgi:hypothetical protein